MWIFWNKLSLGLTLDKWERQGDPPPENGAKEEINTIANRYNGIEENALKAFNDEIFSKHETEDFFYLVAEKFVNKHFLIKNIDNIAYEKNAFSIIQTIVTDLLVEHFDNNEEFFKGFAGYIFRIHFKEVFEFISDMVLAEICSSNQYMINFLKYYSSDIILIDGKKYQVPTIEADNGLKWNVASMMSIVRIDIKAQYAIETSEIKTDKLNKEVASLFVNNISPIEYNLKIKKELDILSQESSYIERKLNLYIDTYDASKDPNEKQNLKNDIVTIRANLLQLREKKEELKSLQINTETITHYTDKKREIDYLKRQTDRELKIIKQNKVAYLSIKHALVKALTSKKILIGKA